MTRAEAVGRVLAGHASYDELDDRAQAEVRAIWAKRISKRIDELDFTNRLREARAAWPEADGEGRVVMRGAAA